MGFGKNGLVSYIIEKNIIEEWVAGKRFKDSEKNFGTDEK